MSKAIRILCVIGIITFLAAAAVTAPRINIQTPLGQSRDVISSYSEHEPIVITSNEDFQEQGWPGSGTVDDPYVIKGLNITNGSTCISVSDTTVYFEIRDCFISASCQNESAGIYLENATRGKVSNTSVELHGYGIHVFKSENSTFTGCFFSRNVWSGFLVDECHNITLTDNTAVTSQFGILAGFSSSCLIRNNTAMNNTDNGIYLWYMDSAVVFLNRMGFNSGTNAYEEGSTSNWDNGTHGNYWDDHDGTGTYSIPGPSSSTDNYPFVLENSAPTIDHPSDIEYELDTTGHSISWEPWDWDPDSYQVYRNGTLMKSGLWNSSSETIDVSIDGLSFGVYNYTAKVNDSSGNTATDMVLVNVTETTSPDIDHPSDIEYELNSTDNSITWNPSDSHPDSYELYRNETLVTSGNWDGDTVVVDIDGRDIGTYNYTIVVCDAYGNSVEDTVFVTVIDTVCPSINSPPDMEYELGTTGHDITWDPSDTKPASYKLYRNTTLLESAEWGGSNITADVDGLSTGIYNYTIVVFDTSDNNATNTVIVTVVDTVSPSINSPPDMEYELGTTGHSITWNASDLNPASYDLYKNGTILESESWNGSIITFDVDGLAEGIHNFTIVFFDGSGNSVCDTVFVTVNSSTSLTTTTTTETTSDTTTGTTEPEDVTPMTLIAGTAVAIGVVVIVAAVYVKRGGQLPRK